MTTAHGSKIGIFGGTFDPVHLGHLTAAREIRNALDLEKIFFIPAGHPPHKNTAEITTPEDRYNMVELAVRDEQYFEALDYEIKKEDISYTIDTLRYLRASYPGTEFYFIAGNELFSTIESWKEYRKLFDLAHFVVMTRPGFEDPSSNTLPLALRDEFRYYKSTENMTFYTDSKSGIIVFINILGVEISSTQIRDQVLKGGSIGDLVPKAVEEYILNKRLYIGEAQT